MSVYSYFVLRLFLLTRLLKSKMINSKEKALSFINYYGTYFYSYKNQQQMNKYTATLSEEKAIKLAQFLSDIMAQHTLEEFWG